MKTVVSKGWNTT